MGILARNWLTVFPPMTYFYTPWKRQKKPLTCSEATEVGYRQAKSYYTYRYLLFITFVCLRQTNGVQIKTSNECIAILFLNAWTEINFYQSNYNYMQLIINLWMAKVKQLHDLLNEWRDQIIRAVHKDFCLDKSIVPYFRRHSWMQFIRSKPNA